MPLTNTPERYGAVARALHWLTALMILTLIGLGLWMTRLPLGADAEVAAAARAYSLHKTLGVAAFATALARILWALTQPRPGLLHPSRRLESFLALAVHWALYGAMLAMPLSGWVHHAALDGFAPILWPFGQGLPFVPKSGRVAEVAGAVHGLFAWVLIAAILLHVAGALKHALIDRDATLARMTRGVAAAVPPQRHSPAPALAAAALWVAVIGAGLALPAPAPSAGAGAAAGGGWEVTEGALGFSVRQMQAEVTGAFHGWTAEIDYDEAARAGAVTVTIPLGQTELGVMTQQALGPEFFDAAAHPEAVFAAEIAEAEGGLAAAGTLTLRGAEVPVTLPFALSIEGDVATMTGQALLDRRDFGMGPSYPDESTVGFAVTVDVALTARRR